MSFPQIPDVTVEVRAAGSTPRLYLFDPKYKLDSQTDDPQAEAAPKKEDIDKMHAYRDAIRGPDGEQIVRFAAILYPGPSQFFAPGGSPRPYVAALRADPERPELLVDALAAELAPALAG
jgi:predicted component of viral defense system (DUF524 family)